jgi:hypothetical protein
LEFPLRSWGIHPNVFAISCQDIFNILTGYYILAGRILSICAEKSGNFSAQVGENVLM